MRRFLNYSDKVRRAEKKIPIKRQIINTAGAALFGIVLGTFSKFLDTVPVDHLPALFSYLDLTNFLGWFSVWIFIAVCISVYSFSAIRAAINVFAFFAGMVLSYYLYSAFIAGFFPKSYAMIWVGFTAVSPLLAFICWYAKGQGGISLFLSAGITAVLFNAAFAYEIGYFSIRSLLDVLTFLGGCVVLRRQTIKSTAIMMAIGVIMAFALDAVVPGGF